MSRHPGSARHDHRTAIVCPIPEMIKPEIVCWSFAQVV